MRFTDVLLLVIAAALIGGVVIAISFMRQTAKDAREIQSGMQALAVAIRYNYFKTDNPIPISLEPSVSRSIDRFTRTAVDIQGMIELTARWMVTQMPPEVIADMEVPEEWTSASQSEK